MRLRSYAAIRRLWLLFCVAPREGPRLHHLPVDASRGYGFAKIAGPYAAAVIAFTTAQSPTHTQGKRTRSPHLQLSECFTPVRQVDFQSNKIKIWLKAEWT